MKAERRLPAAASAGAMIAYPVDKAVGSPKNDRPELIEEIEREA